MSAPRIGVTGMWSNKIHGMRFDGSAVAAAVLQSIVRSGGEPLTLFAESPMTVADRLKDLDALVVPGGFDIDPARYGEEPHETVTLTDNPAQDDFESEIIMGALEAGVPVLAICRGFQLLNVASGGSMIQDLDKESFHRNSMHPVSIETDSLLAEVVGFEELQVSSYHHQALSRIGANLRVVAQAADGIPEALEHQSGNVIAIQWHPEDNAEADSRQKALFDWIVQMGRERKEKRA